MNIESLWNISNREERTAMLAGMGVESSNCLQSWSNCDWDRLPDVVQFSMTAEFQDRTPVQQGGQS